MTVTVTPAPATTYTGAPLSTPGVPLPLMALPQTELLTVNEKDIPLLRDTMGPGIHAKPLRIDIENGEWVLLATLPPGATLPVHYHTGTVQVYTLSGCWYYYEYPDQKQTAGSYLYEPASSVHQFVAPADNTEDTVFFLHVHGTNINFDNDGNFHSILDAALVAHLVTSLAAEQNLGPINYIGGGAVDYTAKNA